MKPTQCIEVNDWVSCATGLPLGSRDFSSEADLNVEVLFECEMEPHEESSYHDIVT
ncbi:jg7886, partial [Pararge aegeria aegeria]